MKSTTFQTNGKTKRLQGEVDHSIAIEFYLNIQNARGVDYV